MRKNKEWVKVRTEPRNKHLTEEREKENVMLGKALVACENQEVLFMIRLNSLSRYLRATTAGEG
jgi:hypothetical protein